MTRNVKMTVSYDGTDFSGYQIQKHERTVERELQKALLKILKQKIVFRSSGRTDAGVHAEGQVINFKTEINSMAESNWLKAMNCLLPNDIRILTCEFVNDDFDSRKSAVKREYQYQFVYSPYITAFENRYYVHINRKLDLELIKKFVNEFIGVHDFSSFCSSKDKNRTKVREIFSFDVVEENRYLIMKITGSAFLHNMIRIIVGTILNLHDNNKTVDDLREIFDRKDRNYAGITYHAKGLVLKKVYY